MYFQPTELGGIIHETNGSGGGSLQIESAVSIAVTNAVKDGVAANTSSTVDALAESKIIVDSSGTTKDIKPLANPADFIVTAESIDTTQGGSKVDATVLGDVKRTEWKGNAGSWRDQSTESPTQKAIEGARQENQLEGEEKKQYDDYVSAIKQKIEGGLTLTEQEETDIRSHYDREIITGRQEMGQELADIGAQVNKKMSENIGKLSETTSGRMADWLHNLFGGKPDEAQKMIIDAVRKEVSERLKNLFASATPEKARQVREMISDLAILEIRYKNSDKVTNKWKHQAWDIREALGYLGNPPSPTEQSDEEFEKRNRFYTPETLLMQKKGETVQQSYLGARIINEYNKSVNEIKIISGERNWRMFQAAKIEGKIFDVSIDTATMAAERKDVEVRLRPVTNRDGKPFRFIKSW